MWRNLINASIGAVRLPNAICLIAAFLLFSCTEVEVIGYDGKWEEGGKLSPDQAKKYYKVREMDTLSDIGVRLGVPYTQLARWNNISPPDYRIYPGQKLFFADVAHEKPGRKQFSGHLEPAWDVNVFSVSQKTLSFRSIPKVQAMPGWGWPFVSASISGFRARYYQNGILLRGKSLQPVVAMADGEVVFRDQEVKYYGTLIIVKHQKNYFSTYAHCNEILVRKGQNVKRGQLIGKINYAKRNLYFEIRHQNLAIDPYHLLAPRSVS